MKVLVLLNAYKDDGPGNLMLSIIKNLMDKGDLKFSTVAISRGGSLKPIFEEMLISTKVIGMKGVFDIKSIISLANYIKKEKFDIIHTNLIRADIVGRYIGRYLKIPIIITTEHGIHTWQFKGKFAEKFVRRLYQASSKFTNKIIAVSEAVKNDLIKNNIPETKIVRIYNGIDTDIFSPISKDEKNKMHSYLSDTPFENLIGVVGNLVPYKGHIYFIEAIPKILKQNPSSMFVIIGEGPIREELEEHVNKQGLSKNVKFLGDLLSILPKMIASLDVFVQPSLTESFGLAVAEAQSCSVPVVASRTGGIPEIIIDGVTGYLVQPENSIEIAEKVNLILSDPKKAAEMGTEGRRNIVEHFNIERTASSYYNIYCDLFYPKESKTDNIANEVIEEKHEAEKKDKVSKEADYLKKDFDTNINDKEKISLENNIEEKPADNSEKKD